MAVTYYRSDDTGAPVLDKNQGSLITVLEAVLVDGYGSKSGAGWTVELDDTATNGVILFKSASTQLGKYYRVQDNGYLDDATGKAGTATNVAVIRGCESYVDIDDTSGNFPNIGLLSDANPDTATNNGLSIFKTYNTTTAGDFPWIIVADDKTVNMFIVTNQPDGVWANISFSWYFNYISFGDCGKLSTSSTNTNLGHVTGNGFNTTYSTNYFYGPLGSIAAGRRYLNRSYQATAGAIEFGWFGILPNLQRSNIIGPISPATAVDRSYYYPSVGYNDAIYGDLVVFEDISATEHSGDILGLDEQFPQATILGIRSVHHHVGAAGYNEIGDLMDTVTINGETHLCLALRYGSNCYASLVQISGDFF